MEETQAHEHTPLRKLTSFLLFVVLRARRKHDDK